MKVSAYCHGLASIVIIATGLILGSFGAVSPARAQSLVATVNGDPVTSLDVDERMKFLRVIKKPATRDAALEDLFAERLKTREAAKYGIRTSDADINSAATILAESVKMQPQAMLAGFQRAGVSSDHIRLRLQADAVFGVYVRSRNRMIEPSETEVRAEIAARGKGAMGTDYKLRQIIFILPSGAGAGVVAQKAREAQQLRGRFTSCDTGAELARSLPDVAVKETFTRNSSTLSDELRKVLDATAVGHLTAPQREQTGIGLIAVCGKTSSTDDTAAREAVSGTILTRKLAGASAALYQDLRARAVIEKR